METGHLTMALGARDALVMRVLGGKAKTVVDREENSLEVALESEHGLGVGDRIQ